MTLPTDYTSATMAEVVAAAALRQPELLREYLLIAARMHNEFAATTRDKTAAAAGRSMADAATFVATELLHAAGEVTDATHVATWTLNSRIIAFAEAARILDIPRSVRGDIAARG